jgi:hypothetical protein
LKVSRLVLQFSTFVKNALGIAKVIAVPSYC